jgi:hypothetical protein
MSAAQRESFLRRTGHPRFARELKVLLERPVIEQDLAPLTRLLHWGEVEQTGAAAGALWKLLREAPAALKIPEEIFACGFIPSPGCIYAPEVIAPLIQWHECLGQLYGWAVSTAPDPRKNPDHSELARIGEELVVLVEEMDEVLAHRLRFWERQEAAT